MNPAWIKKEAEEAFKKMQAKGLAKDKTGGYLTIIDVKTETLTLVIKIGTGSSDMCRRWLTNSQEKAWRLLENHSKLGHVTSAESQNEKKSQYGGAIFTSNTIFSFSGFKPDDDETFSTLLAKTLGVAKQKDLVAINAVRASNQSIKKFPQLCAA